MKNFFLPIIFCFPALFLFSQTENEIFTCRKSKQLFDFSKISGAPSVLATNQRSDTVDILKYTISLNITDFTSDTIRGNTIVKFVPKMNNINTLSLDLLHMTIDSVEINTSNLTSTYTDTLLIVNLPVTYNIGDTSDLIVYYHGKPQMDPSGWGGFYFQSGYAFNLGVGFGANPHNFGRAWFPCFDNFVERSKYEFNITTNSGKIAYCNGALANDTTIGSLRTRKWILNEEIPSYLASVSISTYTQVNWVHNGINDTFPIVLTALAGDTIPMKNSFVNLNNALTAFENRYGPYMWNRVGYCLVPFSSGAMEHATNISYPRLAANGSLTYEANIMAHELSHHWWGDLITCQTAGDMWINEGMATYSQFIFSEWVYGYPAYVNAVRANHDDVIHYVHIREGGYRAISGVPFQYTYGDHVYLKGADVAHSLRGYLGDTAFFAGLNYALYNNVFTDVTSASLLADIGTGANYNLTNFLNDWVLNPGFPHFSIDSFTSVPNGNNYDVTIYVRQKLDGAPNFYTGVPLEITFKDAAWNTATKVVSMSGQLMSFTVTIPINPVFAAIDVNEKISDAITSDAKVIKTTGNSFSQNQEGRMQIKMLAIAANDSAYVRVEHNWVSPDGFKNWGVPYQLSNYHYWKVDGLVPNSVYMQGVINYDARLSTSGGGGHMDDDLLTANNLEDSVVVFYRKNSADDWTLYPYYTKIIANVTDKFGIITLDSLQLGEYTLAINNYMMGVSQPEENLNLVSVFPNPSSGEFTIEFGKVSETKVTVTDVTGKMIYSEMKSGSSRAKLDCSSWPNGVYFILIENNGEITGRNKLVVVH